MTDQRQITASFDSVGEIKITLDGKESLSTVRALMNALPFRGIVNTWGEEIYFEIPVKHSEENGRIDVKAGEVAYWPLGRALCIFFGPTPASKGDAPRAYSPVNVVGRVVEGLNTLRNVKEGCKIRVSRT